MFHEDQSRQNNHDNAHHLKKQSRRPLDSQDRIPFSINCIDDGLSTNFAWVSEAQPVAQLLRQKKVSLNACHRLMQLMRAKLEAYRNKLKSQQQRKSFYKFVVDSCQIRNNQQKGRQDRKLKSKKTK
ncbi:hypothetical protein KIN20_011107 [Parelaphostrongylus tenuis]|uniref:Uncharacterized protein n=1 Tax=Parelaphostrongylus tenuis TaxID=148309 RepID=A0AAD5MCC9_PARTN|nr:hypothetical protein KIN20_011107 [Parelaphostrongylus tenuis]